MIRGNTFKSAGECRCVGADIMVGGEYRSAGWRRGVWPKLAITCCYCGLVFNVPEAWFSPARYQQKLVFEREWRPDFR